MAEQNVVIKILADVSKATGDVKALQEVIAKLSTSGAQSAASTDKLSNSAKKTASASKLLDREIKKVVAGQGNLDRVADLATAALKEQQIAAERLAKVSGVVEQAVGKQGAAALSGSQQISGLADASGSASFALLSLGQAFQDSAQFGMGFAQGLRAVNNNIQQVFTAIALGSVQAGGFANFLKLMGGSLFGAGGLILGFSALSAALEFFTTRAQKAEKEVKNLKGAFDETFSAISPVSGRPSLSIEELQRREKIISLSVKEREAEVYDLGVAISSLKTSGESLAASSSIVNFSIIRDLEERLAKQKEMLPTDRALLSSISESIEQYEDQSSVLKRSIELFGDEGIEKSAVAQTTFDLTRENFKLRQEYSLLSIANDTEIQQLKDQNEQLERQISLRRLQSGGQFGKNVGTLFTFNMLGGPRRKDPEAFYDALVKGEEMAADAFLREAERVEREASRFFPDLPDIDLDLGESVSTSLALTPRVRELRDEFEELYSVIYGEMNEERQEGALNARIEIVNNLRQATIDYSQSIEEMRLLMNQEGQEVIGETQRLQDLNEELRERIRLRRQILGLEDIGSDQLRQLSNSTKDFTSEYARQNRERIKADAEAAESSLNLSEGISRGIGLVSQSFGTMGTTFMQLAQQQENGSKRMFKIGKALAISQAIMNSYQAYTAALADQTMPGPLRFISAGAALAAGLAQVAAIKSTKFGGGGGGGGASSGRSGISSAPTFFTSFGSTADFPASSVGSLSAAGTAGTNISLVVQGRNLVGVIENEVQASSRRVGYSTGVFSGALASSSSTRDVFGGIK